MPSKPRKKRRQALSRRTHSLRRNRSRIPPDLKKLEQASAELYEFAERALRESVRRLEAITKSSRDAIVLYKPGGKIIEVTAACERLFGYAPKELIGQPITMLFPTGLPAFQGPYRKTPSPSSSGSDRKVCSGLHARRKDGRLIELDARFATIGGQENQAVLATVSELTHRSLEIMERALHESEERLRLALFSANIAMWEWDVATDRLTWSLTAENIFDIEPGTVDRYERFAERIHPADLARFEAEREKAIVNREAFTLEFRILHRSGEIRWAAVNGRACYGRNGQPIRVFATIRDITDRYRADAAMRQSEARFRNVFEHAATGIAITTLEGRFLQCNPAYCKLVGYSEGELRHMHRDELVHPDDRAGTEKELQRLRDEEIPFFDRECRYLRKDDRVAWIRKFVSLVSDSGGRPSHLMVLITDITERKRVENELQRSQFELRLRQDQLQDLTTKLLTAQDEERHRVARELHDDFSQRLAALLLEVGSLEQNPPVSPELVPQALESVRMELERLADDIHDLAYKLHPTLLNDAGLEPAIEDHIHKVSQRTGLRIVFKTRHVAKTIPPDVSTCLFRVLQESLQNVVKHAHAREVVIELSGGSKGIALSVTDNGRGFDATGKRSHHHKGLGLDSMQERLRFLNGFLRIHSGSTEGTKVTAWIPCHEVPS